VAAIVAATFCRHLCRYRWPLLPCANTYFPQSGRGLQSRSQASSRLMTKGCLLVDGGTGGILVRHSGRYAWPLERAFPRFPLGYEVQGYY
jgi:hypothetical protein